MTPTSYRIADTLHLVKVEIPSTATSTPVRPDVNHLIVIDCSGSMSADLPQIREQIKLKLPKLLHERDTLSVVWFSGKGQCGTLLEGEPVATLADLQEVNQAIDRWLRPIGLTGFKDPIDEVSGLVDRLRAKRPDSVCSMLFMSDGHDNQWSKSQVLDAVSPLAERLAAATFVEYGYYADRPLLTAMAEKAGGVLTFAEDFDRYAPTVEDVVTGSVSSAPKVAVDVQGDSVGNVAWTMNDGKITTYAIEGTTVLVRENQECLFYLSPSVVGTKGPDITNKSDQLGAVYAAMSLFAVRMRPEVMLPLLKATGDAQFIKSFGQCFGKQRYTAFMEATQKAAFDASVRYVDGYDPTQVPPDDAFTVLELLQLLASDPLNTVLLDHADFKYSRIGRGRVDSSDVLTAEESEEIQQLTTKIASEKNATKVKEYTDRIAAITANKQEPLKFTADKVSTGYPISTLTFNEDRPNVSFLVRKTGTVDLSSRLESAPNGQIPREFRSFQFRNYTVIKDGLVNIDKLPVCVTREVADKLVDAGAVPNDAVVLDADGRTTLVLDLRALPVINRKMATRPSAKTLFEQQFQLECARGAQKVFKAYRDQHFPKEASQTFKDSYGEDGVSWLKEQGITDYSGFSPKSIQAEASDFYMGKSLTVSIKGLSKLPSMKEFQTQLEKGKLNAGGRAMEPAYREVEAFLKSDQHLNASDQNESLKAFLTAKAEDAILTTRRLLFAQARVKFAVVVGQTWFHEFASVEEDSMDVRVDGVDLSCKVTMKDIEVRI